MTFVFSWHVYNRLRKKLRTVFRDAIEVGNGGQECAISSNDIIKSVELNYQIHSFVFSNLQKQWLLDDLLQWRAKSDVRCLEYAYALWLLFSLLCFLLDRVLRCIHDELFLPISWFGCHCKILNFTLIVPELDKHSFWEDPRCGFPGRIKIKTSLLVPSYYFFSQ